MRYDAPSSRGLKRLPAAQDVGTVPLRVHLAFHRVPHGTCDDVRWGKLWVMGARSLGNVSVLERGCPDDEWLGPSEPDD
jgi:hypothetical protein